MVKDLEFLAKAEKIRLTVDPLNAAEMTAFVQKEAAYYTELAAKIGIRR